MPVKLRGRAFTVKVVSLSVELRRFYASLTMFAGSAVIEYQFDCSEGIFYHRIFPKNSVFLLSKKLTLIQRPSPVREGARIPGVMFASAAGQKPLTKREREVLSLISEGYSNKQGALRMRISPRTFESHRAEAMRKLGARNTADLVRTALLHPGNV